MGDLRCVDGSVLSVVAVSCHDCAGRPYEITLNLARNSVPFAAVGQRCGHQLSRLAERLAAARIDPEQVTVWPDPDDRFPDPATELAGQFGDPRAGLVGSADQTGTDRLGGTPHLRAGRTRSPWPGRAGERADSPAGQAADFAGRQTDRPAGSQGSMTAGRLDAFLPGESEYFALRSRDRADLPGTGELRCVLRSNAVWAGECVGTGQQRSLPARHIVPGQRSWPSKHPPPGEGSWRLTRRALIEAWGANGVGVRAVLTSAELVAFLDTVLSEPDPAAAGQAARPGIQSSNSQSAEGRRAGASASTERQRGRMPDGIAGARLPAL
jgi:hypothetical protein